MNINALFFILLLVGGGYYFWEGSKSDEPGDGSDATNPGGGFVGTPLIPLLKTIDAVAEAKKQDEARAKLLKGFVDVFGFDDYDPTTVILFERASCNPTVVGKSVALSEELTRLGIRNQRVSSISFSYPLTPPDWKRYKQLEAMQGNFPIVVIRGRGKANPSLPEIVQEYRGVVEPS